MTQATNPDYHWTPQNMRVFLETLAETGLVGDACEAAGKSRRAAYNARFRCEGRAFALGWDAALLVAPATLADLQMERAIKGYTVTTVRDPETHTTVSERIDSRGASRLLDRLDRMTGLGAAPEPGSDAALARIVSQDFWRFLELVEAGGQGSEAALFIAARTPGEPASECELAEGADAPAGPVEQPETPEARAESLRVWYCEYRDDIVTNFPPPDGFEGREIGLFGDKMYSRTLTEAEEDAYDVIEDRAIAPFRRAAELARDRWFAQASQPANDTGEIEPDVAA